MELVRIVFEHIKTFCPNIEGISIGRANDTSTWRIDFSKDTTDQQRVAALDALFQFDLEAYKTTIRISEVRAECQRRIMIVTGTPNDFQRCMVKQLNALMRATELVNKKTLGEELTESEQAEEQILIKLANAIKALRAKSNILEADPPSDYTDDKYWT